MTIMISQHECVSQRLERKRTSGGIYECES
jgi:hypothetical protein